MKLFRVLKENHQGIAMMNYTDIETEHTRVIEHKHFEPELQSDTTWLTYEYPQEYKADKTEPYYPVNDFKNNTKYSQYKKLANNLENIYFGGRSS